MRDLRTPFLIFIVVGFWSIAIAGYLLSCALASLEIKQTLFWTLLASLLAGQAFFLLIHHFTEARRDLKASILDLTLSIVFVLFLLAIWGPSKLSVKIALTGAWALALLLVIWLGELRE